MYIYVEFMCYINLECHRINLMVLYVILDKKIDM